MFWLYLLLFLAFLAAATWLRLKLRAQRRRAVANRLLNQLGGIIQSQNRTQLSAGSNATQQPRYPLIWAGKNYAVRRKDFVLPEPLTYFCDAPPGVRVDEPCAIRPALPVAAEFSVNQRLPDSPRYDQMTPGQRWTYLSWLEKGRVEPPLESGFLNLFFGGLERRALAEHADWIVVFDEVQRLRTLAARMPAMRGGFDHHAVDFLWHLLLDGPAAFHEHHVRQLADSTHVWNEEHEAAFLSWHAMLEQPLDDWAAYLVAEHDSKSRRSVVIERVADQFRALFTKHYREKYPSGLKVQPAKRERAFRYYPMNESLGLCELSRANPLGLASQFAPLTEIWNQCIEELRKLSSVVAKGSGAKLTVEAWEALPADLRADIDHPLAEPLGDLFSSRKDGDGCVFLPVGQIASVLSIAQRPRLTPTQARKMRDTLDAAGYAIEPDIALTGSSYRWDENVAIFRKSGGAAVDPSRYTAASCVLRISLAVAEAGGNVSDETIAGVTRHMQDAIGVNDAELYRLDLLRRLLAGGESGLSASISRQAKVLTPLQRQALGKLILAMVAADGVITADEQRTVRKSYALLGFEKSEIDAAIQSLLATLAPAGGGSATAESGAAPAELHLDHNAIAAIMRDTQDVARMLADAMKNPDDEDADASAAKTDAAPVTTTTTTTAAASPVASPAPTTTITASQDAAVLAAASGPAAITTSDPSLPQRYAAFCQALLDKPQWPLAEAEALARQHGHMLGGALEALNEWAWDARGAQLFVEDGDRILVEKDVLN